MGITILQKLRKYYAAKTQAECAALTGERVYDECLTMGRYLDEICSLKRKCEGTEDSKAKDTKATPEVAV